eukprot:CAMPEP_0202900588 /NCGR_PEP_ID=MMETSP1392-20130828/11921_1 /ASSEMBLY_ACC=CAM_ASM_000868 /TAXON_ID=225041 /ORGANISM="Chlamydomonas chlamydogama, Strain SAG 11-48b" /LENGTH=136 /DNA_ID=CAMNT_0049587005 /DNA_START=922 /DNA_END=1332 /DNA_ORIENTATION=-
MCSNTQDQVNEVLHIIREPELMEVEYVVVAGNHLGHPAVPWLATWRVVVARMVADHGRVQVGHVVLGSQLIEQGSLDVQVLGVAAAPPGDEPEPCKLWQSPEVINDFVEEVILVGHPVTAFSHEVNQVVRDIADNI